MGNLLQKARPLRAAKYVCMEGADELVRLGFIPFLAETFSTLRPNAVKTKNYVYDSQTVIMAHRSS